MVGVLCGRQYWSRAYEATKYLATVTAACAVVTSSSIPIHAQSLFGFGSAPAAPPSQTAVAQSAAAATQLSEQPRQISRSSRGENAQQNRSHKSGVSRDTAAVEDVNDRQQGARGAGVNSNTEERLQRSRQQVDGGGRRIEDAMAARDATSGKGQGASPQEIDRLFQDFLKWNETRGRH